jgi:hypothetical protein
VIDRCSFCERADVPLVRAKHAATCLDCARLAVELLSYPVEPHEHDAITADAVTTVVPPVGGDRG